MFFNVEINDEFIEQTRIFINPKLEYKISKDPIVCYRNYYRKGKKDLIKYTGRELPHWL